MDKKDERAFQQSLEPVVIIKDADATGNALENRGNSLKNYEDYNQAIMAAANNTIPDISIIPLSKRPQLKIKLFDKEYSQSGKEDKQVKMTRSHNQRQTVRLVSKDEAERANETYTRRKSLPLEKCPICKKFFRRMKTHLMKHEQLSLLKNCNLTNNDPLQCNYCMKIFNTQSNLQIHMRTHTGDKPYVCDVCNKGFAQSCNLVNHMRVHTGEKPFKCPHCDRAFTQSGNLNNHIRLHTDEKPFKCHFCDKAFVQSGNLNSHIRNNHKFIDGGGGLTTDSETLTNQQLSDFNQTI